MKINLYDLKITIFITEEINGHINDTFIPILISISNWKIQNEGQAKVAVGRAVTQALCAQTKPEISEKKQEARIVID